MKVNKSIHVTTVVAPPHHRLGVNAQATKQRPLKGAYAAYIGSFSPLKRALLSSPAIYRRAVWLDGLTGPLPG